MSLLERFSRALAVCERFMNGVAVTMMFLIMMIVVVDVMLRYFFNSPLAWSYELISLYLMVGLFFFTLSDALRENVHVSVDLLHKYMPLRLRHAADMLGYGCASLVFAGIVYASVQRTYVSFIHHDVIAGSFAWPTWLSNIAVPIGATLLLLRMLHRFIGHTLSLIAGRSIIELPPMSGSEGAE